MSIAVRAERLVQALQQLPLLTRELDRRIHRHPAKQVALLAATRGLLIAEASSDFAAGRPVFWLPGFADAQRVLARMLAAGDVCLLMGAGDIDSLGRSLVGA